MSNVCPPPASSKSPSHVETPTIEIDGVLRLDTSEVNDSDLVRCQLMGAFEQILSECDGLSFPAWISIDILTKTIPLEVEFDWSDQDGIAVQVKCSKPTARVCVNKDGPLDYKLEVTR